jgi:hypothetical protein
MIKTIIMTKMMTINMIMVTVVCVVEFLSFLPLPYLIMIIMSLNIMMKKKSKTIFLIMIFMMISQQQFHCEMLMIVIAIDQNMKRTIMLPIDTPVHCAT